MVLAKVKNHAMVHRGPVVSTGRSDYIYAGTQVLLNTLFQLSISSPASLYLCPPLCVPLFLYSPVHPRSSSGTNGYLLYNSHNMVALVPNSMSNKKKKTGALFTHGSPEHKSLLNKDVKVLLEMSALDVAQFLCR